ncbi:hypothetical protein [Lysobacter sp. CA199]|uniref:hypothetical protein n=1 Tax=Lysobacter sp. CA199 TaxID=3455608 RepID=UPI003F8D7E76
MSRRVHGGASLPSRPALLPGHGAIDAAEAFVHALILNAEEVHVVCHSGTHFGETGERFNEDEFDTLGLGRYCSNPSWETTMSFDLMVFEPSVAPTERADFIRWYEEQVQWAEGRGYDDPSVTSPALQRWFADMIRYFPPLNGPFAAEDPDHHPTAAEHCIGRNVIYSAFRWSLADQAYAKMRELAIQHGVGFFHASEEEGEILIPGLGALQSIKKPWWKF